jgi:hypothetical protein
VGTIVRFVTYRNITRGHVEQAAAIVREMVAERPWKTNG